MPAESPSTHRKYPKVLTKLLLRIEGILITEWKPRGADVMLKNINIKRWLTPRLLQFGRRCWEGSSVSWTARAWDDPQYIVSLTEMVKYENWYFCDKLNGVELHQTGNNCFILSSSPKISRLILYPATFVGEAVAVSSSDMKEGNSPQELVLGGLLLHWASPLWQLRIIWFFKLHWQVAQCFSAALD